METRTMRYLTGKAEEMIRYLSAAGVRLAAARVLVFLEHTPDATAREIEEGTAQRQPEISISLHQLMERGWVELRKKEQGHRRHKVRIFSLVRPFDTIVACIDQEWTGGSRVGKVRARVRGARGRFA